MICSKPEWLSATFLFWVIVWTGEPWVNVSQVAHTPHLHCALLLKTMCCFPTLWKWCLHQAYPPWALVLSSLTQVEGQVLFYQPEMKEAEILEIFDQVYFQRCYQVYLASFCCFFNKTQIITPFRCWEFAVLRGSIYHFFLRMHPKGTADRLCLCSRRYLCGVMHMGQLYSTFHVFSSVRVNTPSANWGWWNMVIAWKETFLRIEEIQVTLSRTIL